MTDTKPLVLYRYHDGSQSPNPWKVVIFLYELNLPWEMRVLDRSDPDIRDKEPMSSLSPNGRMPVLHDPNTGVKLWESAAIIEYLLDVYDRDHRLSYTTFPEKHEQNCWKHFQMSGQGPYFGQMGWFLYLHHEKVESAQKRYLDEAWRILGVIEKHLVATKRPYLLGPRWCFVDLMFVPWNEVAFNFVMGPGSREEWQRRYPACFDWHRRLLELECVKKAAEFVKGSASSDDFDVEKHRN